MQKKIMFLLLAIVFTFGSVSVTASTAKDNDVGFIDSRLSDYDKKLLKVIMKNLDPEDQKSVLYISEDGYFTSNRWETVQEIKSKYKDIITKDGKLMKDLDTPLEQSTNFSTMAYGNPTVACSAENSGPYRRVMSQSGYSRLTTTIYLPSKTAGEAYMNGTASSQDKGYIYTGAVTSGGGIDMGLTLNYTAGSSSTMETWGMFITGHTSIVTEDYGNFKLGTSVNLKYYTPANNQAALAVTGVNKAGNPVAHTLVVAISPSKNFRADGVGMQIKRVTSVGQVRGFENLTTGSYIKNVHWQDVKVGTTSGSEVLMNGTNTQSFCAYKTTNVLVDYVSQSDEKVWVRAGNLP